MTAARPTVVVVSALTGPVETAVLAGIEEEGVPYQVDRVSPDAGVATDLARSAARRSPLGVGVGIDAGGLVCVQPDKVAEPVPELTAMAAGDHRAARVLGHDAARLCVGLPLRLL